MQRTILDAIAADLAVLERNGNIIFIRHGLAGAMKTAEEIVDRKWTAVGELTNGWKYTFAGGRGALKSRESADWEETRGLNSMLKAFRAIMIVVPS